MEVVSQLSDAKRIWLEGHGVYVNKISVFRICSSLRFFGHDKDVSLEYSVDEVLGLAESVC